MAQTQNFKCKLHSSTLVYKYAVPSIQSYCNPRIKTTICTVLPTHKLSCSCSTFHSFMWCKTDSQSKSSATANNFFHSPIAIVCISVSILIFQVLSFSVHVCIHGKNLEMKSLNASVILKILSLLKELSNMVKPPYCYILTFLFTKWHVLML